MRKALVLFILLTAGAATGAWFVASQLGGTDASLASLAPRDTVLYLEASDLKSAAERIRGSAIAGDFLRSRTHAEMSKVWNQLKEAGQKGEGPLKELASLGLALDDETALLFAGQGVALGLTSPAEGPPAAYAMSRIDLLGLAQELAANGQDWLDVWSKLRAKVSPDGKVEEFQGYQIASRKVQDSPERLVYFTQAKDMVFASTQRWAVVAFLKAHLKQSQGLDTHPGFAAMEKLPSENLVAKAWIDFGFFRDGNKVKQLLVGLAKLEDEQAAAKLEKELKGTELKVLAQDTKELPGLAAGVYFAGGASYALDLKLSHPADEIFTETSTLSPEAVSGADPAFYVELPRLGRVLSGVLSSKGWETLSSTEAWKWLEKKLEKPEELTKLVPMGRSDFEEELVHDPRFETRLALAIGDLVLPELAGDRFLMSVQIRKDAPKGELPIDTVTVSTLRPIPRLLAAVLAGVAESTAEKSGLKTQAIAGRTAYLVGKPGTPESVCVVLSGMDLVVTQRPEAMEGVFAAKASEGATTLTTMRAAIAGEPGGLLFYDMAQATSAIQHFSQLAQGDRAASQRAYYEEEIQNLKRQRDEAQDEPTKEFFSEQIKQMEGILADLSAEPTDAMPEQLRDLSGQALIAFRVADDYGSIRVQSVQRNGKKVQGYVGPLYPAGQSVEDAQLSRLPAKTFASATLRFDALGFYKGIKAGLGEEMFKDAEAELQRKLLGEGVTFEKDVLAHLGDWAALGVVQQPTYAPQDAPEGMPVVAVPAFVGLLAYKNEAFKERALAMAESALQGLLAAPGGGEEGAAIGGLYTINSAQSLFREGDKDDNGQLDYADSWETLVKYDLVYDDPESPYVFKVQRGAAKPEFTWMATATPKSGVGKHFAMNHTGLVYHSWTPFAFNDACEFASDALTTDAELGPPPAEQKAPQADPVLVKETLDGHEVYVVSLPKRMSREFGPAGTGFSPCLAFHEGALVFATSKPALLASLSKAEGGLAAQPTFKRLSAPLAQRGSALSHLALAGIIDQVLENADLIAKEGAPLPPELKAPEYPEYREPPEGADMEAFYKEQEELQAKWQEAYEAHRTKSKEWRATHAAENAATLRKLLGSLRVLGGAASSAWSEGELLRGDMTLGLDPAAAAPSK